MATISEIVRFIDHLAPHELGCDWDNDGLQVFDGNDKEVQKILISLDATDNVIKRAVIGKFDMIITHHPLMFNKISCINACDCGSKRGIALLLSGIAQLSVHTRLDKAEGGVNDALAEKLGLTNVVPFGEENMGRIGTIKDTSAEEFAGFLKNVLGADSVRYVSGVKNITKVAVLGGAGKDAVDEAISCGADAYVTGDVSYSVFCEADKKGFSVFDAGHYFTEYPVCDKIAHYIKERFPEIITEIYNDKTVKEV